MRFLAFTFQRYMHPAKAMMLAYLTLRGGQIALIAGVGWLLWRLVGS